MEARRRALDEIAVRQRAADDKRQKEAAQRQQAAALGPMPPTRLLVRSPVQDLRQGSVDVRPAAGKSAACLVPIGEMQRH